MSCYYTHGFLGFARNDRLWALGLTLDSPKDLFYASHSYNTSCSIGYNFWQTYWCTIGFALSPESHFGKSLNFFIYDSIKILILLFVIVTLMGVVNSFLPISRLRGYLQNNKLFGFEYVLASLFGAITPFCSCSSVPLFIGFVQGGIPLGVTLAFLITSPLVNEIALALFIGFFGWKVTLVYAISGILLGALGGMILSRLKLEQYLTPWVQELIAKKQERAQAQAEENLPFWQKLRQEWPAIFAEAKSIVRGVVLFVLVGIAIGAAMHGYVPENFFEQYMSAGDWWVVPASVVLSVPIYSNAAAIAPLVNVLVSKGVAIGTAIAFMMGTIGLSIPEATLLKKVMQMRLILIYFGVVTALIIVSGFLFNFLLNDIVVTA